jgi:hypothetical protein
MHHQDLGVPPCSRPLLDWLICRQLFRRGRRAFANDIDEVAGRPRCNADGPQFGWRPGPAGWRRSRRSIKAPLSRLVLPLVEREKDGMMPEPAACGCVYRQSSLDAAVHPRPTATTTEWQEARKPARSTWSRTVTEMATASAPCPTPATTPPSDGRPWLMPSCTARFEVTLKRKKPRTGRGFFMRVVPDLSSGGP